MDPSNQNNKPGQPDPKSALDRIENTLYDPKKTQSDFMIRQTKDGSQKALPTSWTNVDTSSGEHPAIKEGMSFGTKLLILSAFILVLSFSFTAWRVMSSRNVVSADNIDINLDVSPYIESGERSPLRVTVTNKNTIPLEATSITVVYKKGTGSQDQEEKVNEKNDGGTLVQKGVLTQDYSLVFFGGEAEQRDVIVKFEYKVTGSNATFSKVVQTPVILKTPSMELSVDGPKSLSVGQSGTFSVTVKNNTSTTSQPSALVLTLPNSFVLESASPKPYARTTSWEIKSLKKGEQTVITFSGVMSGSSGEIASIRAVVGAVGQSSSDIEVKYAESIYDIKLRQSPMLITVALDTDRGATGQLRFGDDATVSLTYKNVSELPLKNISLVAALKGDAYLPKGINPETGFYDSIKQIITWETGSLSDLGTLLPGQERTVKVRIPIVLSGTNSPKLTVDVTGTASQQESGDVVTMITSAWAVQGSATVNANTAYKNSPFVNSGPVPPRPNVDTTYTAHLSVSAQNALVQSQVTFTLPVYVTWRNITSDSQRITYDPRTRLVTWAIDSLEAGKTLSVDIGLSVHPSQSHVGTSPAITSPIVLEATEDVSKVSIKNTLSPLTTFISGENWQSNPSKVVDR